MMRLVVMVFVILMIPVLVFLMALVLWVLFFLVIVVVAGSSLPFTVIMGVILHLRLAPLPGASIQRHE